MSFDISQLHIPDNSPEASVIEAIIQRDHVSVEEAIRTVLRNVAREQGPSGYQVSDDELARLDALCPALRMMDDVPDEVWEGIAETSRQISREGLRAGSRVGLSAQA